MAVLSEITQVEKEKLHMFYLIIHIAKSCNSQGWARLELGTRNNIQISHMGSRSPLSSFTVIHCLLDTAAGIWVGSRVATQAVTGALTRGASFQRFNLLHHKLVRLWSICACVCGLCSLE